MKRILNFPSQLENITIVEKLIDELSDTYKLNTELYGNILVSVVESVSNAILHGNQSDVSKFVHIECFVHNENISFIVSDEGTGFNFKDIPDATLPENIDIPHGRGIFLMHRLADSVQFDKNGSQVAISFRISN